MMVEVKNTVKLTKSELESIVSKAMGMDVKIEKWKIKSEGDYDRGTYKETLMDVTFCSGRLIEVPDEEMVEAKGFTPSMLSPGR